MNSQSPLMAAWSLSKLLDEILNFVTSPERLALVVILALAFGLFIMFRAKPPV